MSDMDWRRLHGRIIPNSISMSNFQAIFLSGKLHEQYLAKDLHKIIKEMREILHEHGELREAANFPLSGKKSDLARAAAAAAHLLTFPEQQQQQQHHQQQQAPRYAHSYTSSALMTPTLSLIPAHTSRTPGHPLPSNSMPMHSMPSSRHAKTRSPRSSSSSSSSSSSTAGRVGHAGGGECSNNQREDALAHVPAAIHLRGPPHVLMMPALDLGAHTRVPPPPEYGSTSAIDSPALLPSPSVRLSSTVEWEGGVRAQRRRGGHRRM